MNKYLCWFDSINMYRKEVFEENIHEAAKRFSYPYLNDSPNGSRIVIVQEESGQHWCVVVSSFVEIHLKIDRCIQMEEVVRQ